MAGLARRLFDGGFYVDALPTGEYCILYPGNGIYTHLGKLALPPGEAFGPLYLRCTNVGAFRFAGQAHDSLDPAAFEWRQGLGWKPYAPPCVGVSPVLYDSAGVLHLSDGSIGSQGYRYVAPDGRLVSGDESYGPEQGLNEWTALANGWRIGQTADGTGLPQGVLLWDGTSHRVIETGECRFIRVHEDAGRIAVSFIRPGGAVIVLGTLADLAALPVCDVEPPTPVPVPEDDMRRPVIDVQHYDSQIRPGQPWQTDFVLGGQTAVTVRIGADGNLRISAKNTAGEDITGKARHVDVQ